jgi:hypothetical protein
MTDYELTEAIEKAQKHYSYAKGRERTLWFQHLQILLKVREIRLLVHTKARGESQ